NCWPATVSRRKTMIGADDSHAFASIRKIGDGRDPKQPDATIVRMSPNQPGHPPKLPIPGVRNLIAVGSGKGGVGKTTVAVNLSIALAKLGNKVGLLDADVYGPNVPLMMGINKTPMAKGDRIQPLENYGVKLM